MAEVQYLCWVLCYLINEIYNRGDNERRADTELRGAAVAIAKSVVVESVGQSLSRQSSRRLGFCCWLVVTNNVLIL